MSKEKRPGGDRPDGVRLRNLDSYHIILPYLLPHRCDAEAFMRETVDVTAVFEYLRQKNAGSPPVKTTLFHVFTAALVKTVALRPHLNRFIRGYRYYQRRKISTAFVAKKEFSDQGEETLLCLNFDENTTLADVSNRISGEVRQARSEKGQNVDKLLDTLAKMPRFMLRMFMGVLRTLNFHGRLPGSLTRMDPNHCTVFISNMGSIKAGAPYHHLNNFGTNSIFVTIGEIHKQAFYDGEGNCRLRDVVDFGITLDERISDGYYFSQSIKLMKHLLAHPELLEGPAKEAVHGIP